MNKKERYPSTLPPGTWKAELGERLTSIEEGRARKKRQQIWLSLVIIPGVFAGLLLFAAANVLWNEVHVPPEIVANDVDDTGFRAAPIIAAFVIVGYTGYLVLLGFVWLIMRSSRNSKLSEP